MAAAMGAVALVAIVLLSVSAIDNAAVCSVNCALMATIAAMWPHRREYAMRGEVGSVLLRPAPALAAINAR